MRIFDWQIRSCFPCRCSYPECLVASLRLRPALSSESESTIGDRQDRDLYEVDNHPVQCWSLTFWWSLADSGSSQLDKLNILRFPMINIFSLLCLLILFEVYDWLWKIRDTEGSQINIESFLFAQIKSISIHIKA